MDQLRLLIEGRWTDGATCVPLRDKATGQVVADVHCAGPEQVARATRAAAHAQEQDVTAPYDRYEYLATASVLLQNQATQFVESIVIDTGFTAQEARKEVMRACETLRLCAEEAKRISGEVVPIDSGPDRASRIALTMYRPLGVVCAITPFNSPLNTVVHKIGPALAAGNAVVVKPSILTPLTASLLSELLLEAGVPPDLLALIHGSGATVGEQLLVDPVPSFYAFTGSTAVGRHIRGAIGLRRCQLELGSISSAFVLADADLATALPKCLDAGYRKSGQVCTSVQRLYVEEACYEEFLAAAGEYLEARHAGDPRASGTYLGPVITEEAATRIRDSVSTAVSQGASVIAGNADRAVGPYVDPTIVVGAMPDMSVMSSEIFGPVVCVRSFRSLDDAVAEANATPYGLAAGLFTDRIDAALRAARLLRFGVVNINETSSARVDLCPFGGVKDSGQGREGPRYAIREMMEERLVTIQG